VSQFFGTDGAGASIVGFDGIPNCWAAQPTNWLPVPASSHLFSTSGGSDVVLSTRGGRPSAEVLRWHNEHIFEQDAA